MWNYYYKIPTECGYQLERRSQEVYGLKDYEITELEYNILSEEIKERRGTIDKYVSQINADEITLEDVPEEYRAEVEVIINQPEEEQTYTLDEVAELLTQEVANEV